MQDKFLHYSHIQSTVWSLVMLEMQSILAWLQLTMLCQASELLHSTVVHIYTWLLSFWTRILFSYLAVVTC